MSALSPFYPRFGHWSAPPARQLRAKTGREADATNDPRGHSIASSAAAPQNIASRLAKHRRSEHS